MTRNRNKVVEAFNKAGITFSEVGRTYRGWIVICLHTPTISQRLTIEQTLNCQCLIDLRDVAYLTDFKRI